MSASASENDYSDDGSSTSSDSVRRLCGKRSRPSGGVHTKGPAGLQKSSFRGVSYDRKKRKFRVQIKVACLGKSGISVGYYDSEEAGARAYDRAAISLLGRGNANLVTNFPLQDYADLQIPSLTGKARDEVKKTLKQERLKYDPARRRGSSTKTQTSKFIGVCATARRPHQWQVRMMINGRATHLGYYADEQEAACVYDTVSLALLGDEASTNFPPASYSEEDIAKYRGLSREEVQRALGVGTAERKSNMAAYETDGSSSDKEPGDTQGGNGKATGDKTTEEGIPTPERQPPRPRRRLRQRIMSAEDVDHSDCEEGKEAAAAAATAMPGTPKPATADEQQGNPGTRPPSDLRCTTNGPATAAPATAQATNINSDQCSSRDTASQQALRLNLAAALGGHTFMPSTKQSFSAVLKDALADESLCAARALFPGKVPILAAIPPQPRSQAGDPSYVAERAAATSWSVDHGAAGLPHKQAHRALRPGVVYSKSAASMCDVELPSPSRQGARPLPRMFDPLCSPMWSSTEWRATKSFSGAALRPSNATQYPPITEVHYLTMPVILPVPETTVSRHTCFGSQSVPVAQRAGLVSRAPSMFESLYTNTVNGLTLRADLSGTAWTSSVEQGWACETQTAHSNQHLRPMQQADPTNNGRTTQLDMLDVMIPNFDDPMLGLCSPTASAGRQCAAGDVPGSLGAPSQSSAPDTAGDLLLNALEDAMI